MMAESDSLPRDGPVGRLRTGTQSVEAVVVGAGPYGLSVAAHLRAAGIEVRTFGDPMGAWRHHMPRGMYLKSVFDASSLSAPRAGSSLHDYCLAAGVPALDDHNPLPLDMFIDYGLWFQRRHVGDLSPLSVTRVSPAANGFQVSLEDGDVLSARRVVVCSGHVAFAHVPHELRMCRGADEPTGQGVTHSSRHPDLSRFAGRVVAVVGAGQSAVESAVLLREAGAQVHLIVRGPSILWGGPPPQSRPSLIQRTIKPSSPLGPGWSLLAVSRAPDLFACLPASTRLFLVKHVLGPSGGWWLHERFQPKINVALETVVQEGSVSSGKVWLRLRARSGSVSQLAVDHVVAATGYRVDIGAIGFLDPAIRSRIALVGRTAAPHLAHSFESSVPGLYFTGLSAAATFGPVLRFVCGSDFTARVICRSLLRSRAAPARGRLRLPRWGRRERSRFGAQRQPETG